MNDHNYVVLKSEGGGSLGWEESARTWEIPRERGTGGLFPAKWMSLSRVPSKFHEMETLKDMLPFEQRKFHHHQERMSVLCFVEIKVSLSTWANAMLILELYLVSKLSSLRHWTVFIRQPSLRLEKLETEKTCQLSSPCLVFSYKPNVRLRKRH